MKYSLYLASSCPLRLSPSEDAECFAELMLQLPLMHLVRLLAQCSLLRLSPARNCEIRPSLNVPPQGCRSLATGADVQVTASHIQTRDARAFSVMTLAIYVLYVFVAAGVSYGAHIPCGLFTPSLLIGSSLGYVSLLLWYSLYC